MNWEIAAEDSVRRQKSRNQLASRDLGFANLLRVSSTKF